MEFCATPSHHGFSTYECFFFAQHDKHRSRDHALLPPKAASLIRIEFAESPNLERLAPQKSEAEIPEAVTTLNLNISVRTRYIQNGNRLQCFPGCIEKPQSLQRVIQTPHRSALNDLKTVDPSMVQSPGPSLSSSKASSITRASSFFREEARSDLATQRFRVRSSVGLFFVELLLPSAVSLRCQASG